MVVPDGASRPCRRFPSSIRACITTIGAIEGNIIAAIITTHAVTQKPSVPGSVPGPASMPAIRSSVSTQARAASTSSPRISESRTTSGRAGVRLRDADSMPPVLAAALRGSLGHLACEFVIGRLAVDGVELDPVGAHLPRRPSHPELWREAEHRVTDSGLCTASLRSLEWLEGEAAVADRA